MHFCHMQVLGRLFPKTKQVAVSEWAVIEAEANKIWKEVTEYAEKTPDCKVVGNTCTVGDLEVVDVSESECAADYK